MPPDYFFPVPVAQGYDMPDICANPRNSKGVNDMGMASIGYGSMPPHGSGPMFPLPNQQMPYPNMNPRQIRSGGTYPPNNHQAALAMQQAQRFANGMQPYVPPVSHPYWNFPIGQTLIPPAESSNQSPNPIHSNGMPLQRDQHNDQQSPENIQSIHGNVQQTETQQQSQEDQRPLQGGSEHELHAVQ